MHAAGAYVNANVTALQTGYLLHQTVSISVQIQLFMEQDEHDPVLL